MKQAASELYKTKRQHSGWVFDPRTKMIALIELDFFRPLAVL